MTTSTDPTFLRFLAAIKQQESGGNYGAHSATGAIGAYQIMPANIGPWSAQALGHPVTVDQFAHSPSLQDSVASFELLKLYNTYGARAAAAAWYSGNPQLANDYTKDRYGQSPGDYADEVLQKMGSISATDAANSSSTGSQSWASPGHWYGANGQPIPDPPTDVKYDDPKHPTLGNGGGPILGDTKANAKKSWSDSTWTAVIQWLISYGGTSSQDGPNLSTIKPPYSDNDKGFVFDLYAHTVTSQSRGQQFNPSTGEAIPGSGPTPNPLAALASLLSMLSNGTFWKRVGLGAIGAAILIAMVLWVERKNIGTAAKLAAL